MSHHYKLQCAYTGTMTPLLQFRANGLEQALEHAQRLANATGLSFRLVPPANAPNCALPYGVRPG